MPHRGNARNTIWRSLLSSDFEQNQVPGIELTTRLPASADRVWQELRKPALLEHVAAGRLRFVPIEPPALPEHWQDGDYRVALRGFGWLPLGEQVISIRIRDEDRTLHDRGSSRFFRRWDHRISVEPDGPDATRYTDSVEFDAGILDPLLLPLVKDFFRHRQRRWRRLVENGFDHTRA